MKAEDRSVCVFCSLGSRPFKVGEMEFQFLLGRSFGLKYWEFQRLKKAKYCVILEQHQFLATANPRGEKWGPKVAGVLKNRVFQKSWFNLMICKPLSTKGFVVMECVVFCFVYWECQCSQIWGMLRYKGNKMNCFSRDLSLSDLVPQDNRGCNMKINKKCIN